MQLPTKKTPVQKCLELASFTGRMLVKHGDGNATLIALGSKLDGERIALRTADRNVEDMREALVLTRVEVVYENPASDTWLQRLQKRAESSMVARAAA